MAQSGQMFPFQSLGRRQKLQYPLPVLFHTRANLLCLEAGRKCEDMSKHSYSVTAAPLLSMGNSEGGSADTLPPLHPLRILSPAIPARPP